MGNSCTGSNKDKEEERDGNHRLLQVLQLLDIDGDGFVGDRDLRESPWTKYSAAGASEILKVFDQDRDGKLNQEEFANWYREGNKKKLSEAEMRAKFDELDLDGNGFLSTSELQTLVRHCYQCLY